MFDLTEKTEKELDILLSSRNCFPQRKWIYAKEGKVFLRVTQHFNSSTKSFLKTLDLSSVEIEEKRKGVFKELLLLFEEKANESGRVLFIENVINEDLCDFLKSKKYVQDNTNGIPCFWYPNSIFLSELISRKPQPKSSHKCSL